MQRSGCWIAVLSLVVVFLAGFGLAQSFSANERSFHGIDFATSGTALKFLDRTTGTVYLYSEIDGKLYDSWKIIELGERLEEHR